ncbi:glycosyltransferase [Pseudomonas nabeulensis]|uniref:Glycosyltransferase n=1 Tax=Pseudomonas nabeulensis TaxID=2293833 RepID=A0A4Z0B170_9PSED|nr:glycosyltransferase [Pseudomonas nabeulensis]TFY92297.1 glycosyltransferase [Pseudomonas nabeulensis]
MNRKIAVGTVVFHAGEELLRRLEMASAEEFDVYVFDNSPGTENVRELARRIPQIHYFTCGKNLGLAIGISTISANAYHAGHKALLFFDQDTGFNNETLSYVEQKYAENVIAYKNYSAIAFKSEGDASVRDVSLLINSGSLYFLEKLNSLAWLDCTYFVDGVDYKLCLDSLNQGYRVGACGATPGFDHTTEQADDRYYIAGRTYSMRAYSRLRIKDTLSSSRKLIFSALKTYRFSFAANIFKLLAIYCATQFFVRLINTLGIFKRD